MDEIIINVLRRSYFNNHSILKLPWKSFIDIGVVIGLSWGFVFILIWWVKVGALNTWPEWVPDEYPENFVIRYPDNVLVKNPSYFSR